MYKILKYRRSWAVSVRAGEQRQARARQVARERVAWRVVRGGVGARGPETGRRGTCPWRCRATSRVGGFRPCAALRPNRPTVCTTPCSSCLELEHPGTVDFPHEKNAGDAPHQSPNTPTTCTNSFLHHHLIATPCCYQELAIGQGNQVTYSICCTCTRKRRAQDLCMFQSQKKISFIIIWSDVILVSE